MPDQTTDLIEKEADIAVTLQRSLVEATQQIRALQEQVDEAWSKVKEVAIEAYKEGRIQKTTKYDWGTITIKDLTDFMIDRDALPKKFWVSVPNTNMIRSTYGLEGKPPKGVEVVKSLGFMKRIKGVE